MGRSTVGVLDFILNTSLRRYLEQQIERQLRQESIVASAYLELDGEALAKVENHANRPEVRQAIGRGAGKAVRYSATVHTNYMYLARQSDRRAGGSFTAERSNLQPD